MVSYSLSKFSFLSQNLSIELESKDDIFAPGHDQSQLIFSSEHQNHGLILAFLIAKFDKK